MCCRNMGTAVEDRRGGQLGVEAFSPNKPEETLSCGVLLGLQLVQAQVLQGGGFGRGGEETLTDFLYFNGSDFKS